MKILEEALAAYQKVVDARKARDAKIAQLRVTIAGGIVSEVSFKTKKKRERKQKLKLKKKQKRTLKKVLFFMNDKQKEKESKRRVKQKIKRKNSFFLTFLKRWG